MTITEWVKKNEMDKRQKNREKMSRKIIKTTNFIITLIAGILMGYAWCWLALR